MLAAYAVALATLGHSAWTGAIGTATLLASAQALTQMEGLGMLGDMQTMVIRQQALLLDLEDLSTVCPTPTPDLHADPADRNARPPCRCHDVRFTYPGRRVRPSTA